MNAITIAIIAAALLGLTFVLLYTARRRMVAFDIRVRDGKADLHSGTPSAAFLSDVQEIVARNDVRQGTILGARKGSRVQLLFHGSISKDAQQQIRNAWSVLR